MFDIGFSEIFLIAVVALIVLGPEKLPRAARFAGLWVRKARAQWYAVKSEFEQDLAADELKRSLTETRESLRQAEEQLRSGVGSIRDRMQKEFDDVSAAATAGVEPGAGTAPEDASQESDAQPNRHEDEEERSLESASAMDWEPPLPSDDDDGVPVEDAEAAPHPPKQPDDAHAGR
ncbi:Twin-arginine translocation protein TatB [Lysobacter dokdonensis DS-58]|uniref:Sec-independent protein translocase protein TatB n=1 Tax=Lysobacter dokdonensis DS-58 TaxID=1300345 RepID=A0A0A2WG28_9GAMM|nr:Sec-independent protein translocase protein TatB [Lysobacter dokdonensis]KGQ19146.1 Twin-arginine translocation protein TatB [Lysobacter dokdonensis DS-58]